MIRAVFAIESVLGDVDCGFLGGTRRIGHAAGRGDRTSEGWVLAEGLQDQPLGRQYTRSLEWALSKLPPSSLTLGERARG